MALLLATRQALLRGLASPSVRHSATSTRALAVRAFKQEDKHQAHKQDAAPAPVAPSEPATSAVAPPRPLQAVPFMRMSDAMLQMQREMDAFMEAFDDPFFGGVGSRRRPLGGPLSPFSLLADSLLPSDAAAAPSSSMARAVMGPLSRVVPVEVEEDEHAVTVSAEVPGFSRADIKVTVDPARNLLTISGEKTTSTGEGGAKAGEGAAPAEGGATPTSTARSSMSFMRSFTLPPDVDLEKDIKATAEHGVLKVVLPKAPHKEPHSTVRQIPIA